MPVLRLAWGALLALIVAGCGPPTVYDVAGRPVKEPAYLADVRGGWIAIDSTDDGIRAVLEWQLPIADNPALPGELATPVLQLESGRVLWPYRFRWDPPQCWPVNPTRRRCEQARGDEKYCAWTIQPSGAECFSVLRAEFALGDWPQASDMVLAGISDSLAVTRLAVVESTK